MDVGVGVILDYLQTQSIWLFKDQLMKVMATMMVMMMILFCTRAPALPDMAKFSQKAQAQDKPRPHVALFLSTMIFYSKNMLLFLLQICIGTHQNLGNGWSKSIVLGNKVVFRNGATKSARCKVMTKYILIYFDIFH